METLESSLGFAENQSRVAQAALPIMLRGKGDPLPLCCKRKSEERWEDVGEPAAVEDQWTGVSAPDQVCEVWEESTSDCELERNSGMKIGSIGSIAIMSVSMSRECDGNNPAVSASSAP